MTASDLGDAFKFLGVVAKAAVNFGAIEYVRTEDIANIDLLTLLPIFETLKTETGQAQVGKYINGVLATAANIVLDMLNTEADASAKDFGEVDVENAAEQLSNIITALDTILKEASTALPEIKRLSGILNLDFANIDIKSVVTSEMARAAVDAIQALFNIKVLQTVLPKIVKVGLSLVESKIPADLDLSFLLDDLKNEAILGEQLASDIKTIGEIIKAVIDLNAIEIYQGKDVAEISVDALDQIVDKFGQIYIFRNYIKYTYIK